MAKVCLKKNRNLCLLCIVLFGVLLGLIYTWQPTQAGTSFVTADVFYTDGSTEVLPLPPPGGYPGVGNLIASQSITPSNWITISPTSGEIVIIGGGWAGDLMIIDEEGHVAKYNLGETNGDQTDCFLIIGTTKQFWMKMMSGSVGYEKRAYSAAQGNLLEIAATKQKSMIDAGPCTAVEVWVIGQPKVAAPTPTNTPAPIQTTTIVVIYQDGTISNTLPSGGGTYEGVGNQKSVSNYDPSNGQIALNAASNEVLLLGGGPLLKAWSQISNQTYFIGTVNGTGTDCAMLVMSNSYVTGEILQGSASAEVLEYDTTKGDLLAVAVQKAADMKQGTCQTLGIMVVGAVKKVAPPTPTNTPTSATTPNATPTFTSTPVGQPATATNTPVPGATATHTATPIPTDEPTPTNTPTWPSMPVWATVVVSTSMGVYTDGTYKTVQLGAGSYQGVGDVVVQANYVFSQTAQLALENQQVMLLGGGTYAQLTLPVQHIKFLLGSSDVTKGTCYQVISVGGIQTQFTVLAGSAASETRTFTGLRMSALQVAAQKAQDMKANPACKGEIITLVVGLAETKTLYLPMIRR